jgi:hypothetical protein
VLNLNRLTADKGLRMLFKLLWQPGPGGIVHPLYERDRLWPLQAALKLPLVLIPLPALVVGLLLANGSL